MSFYWKLTKVSLEINCTMKKITVQREIEKKEMKEAMNRVEKIIKVGIRWENETINTDLRKQLLTAFLKDDIDFFGCNIGS